tara:strand:- start:3746 stop:4081 length:336 start_codon:yes stop_codon:yes gene_type:complete
MLIKTSEGGFEEPGFSHFLQWVIYKESQIKIGFGVVLEPLWKDFLRFIKIKLGGGKFKYIYTRDQLLQANLNYIKELYDEKLLLRNLLGYKNNLLLEQEIKQKKKRAKMFN